MSDDTLCSHCGKIFSRTSTLNRHVCDVHKIIPGNVLCSHCGKTFSKTSSLNRHIRNVHKIKYYMRWSRSQNDSNTSTSCGECGKKFASRKHVRHHMKHSHPDKLPNNSPKSLNEKPKMPSIKKKRRIDGNTISNTIIVSILLLFESE